MMQKILIIVLLLGFCFGAVGENKIWQRGYTFLQFLEENHIPLRLYYNLSSRDKELTAEINAGIEYQVFRNQEGVLLQALIPIDDDVQIHIYQDHFQYNLTFIPIKFFTKDQTLALRVSNSVHQDIFEVSKDLGLSNEILNTYKSSINFKKEVILGDRLVILYGRKYRFGKFFGTPMIQASMIETNKTPNYLIAYNEGRFYNLKGEEVIGFLLQMPLKTIFVTSKFSKSRRHPVMKTMIRPHFGVDFRARIGTPVYSAGSGRVVAMGWRGGYGKTVEILHDGGLKTLYAHLSKIESKIHIGSYVKQGRLIARSGNTGMSSGPHLHFGLYKNGRPIDPLGSIKTTRSRLNSKEKQEFFKIAQVYKMKIVQEIDKLDLKQN